MKYTIVEYNAYDDAVDVSGGYGEFFQSRHDSLQRILDDNEDKIFCGFVATIQKHYYHLVFRECTPCSIEAMHERIHELYHDGLELQK